MLHNTLATKVLSLLIQKPTDKREPIFMVFSSDHPNQIAITNSGKFEVDKSFPLISEVEQEDGTKSFEFSFFTHPLAMTHATRIEKELSLQGTYSYRVLEYRGFITPEVSAAISLNCFETLEFQYGRNTGLSSDEKIASMNKLLALGKQNAVSQLVGGAKTMASIEGVEEDENENF